MARLPRTATRPRGTTSRLSGCATRPAARTCTCARCAYRIDPQACVLPREPDRLDGVAQAVDHLGVVVPRLVAAEGPPLVSEIAQRYRPRDVPERAPQKPAGERPPTVGLPAGARPARAQAS